MNNEFSSQGRENWLNLSLPQSIRLRHYPVAESTNSLALDLGQPGDLFVADAQTEGRGRLGRPWFSPPGENLYFSLVLAPPAPLEQWVNLALSAGLALARITEGLGFVPALKWPNDLILKEKKAAGILLEARGSKLVVGIGINVNQREFPPELRGKATSLALVSSRAWSRQKILEALVPELLGLAELWYQAPQQVLDWWQHYDFLHNKVVELCRGNQCFTGFARGLGPGGELVLEDLAGNVQLFASGEATLSKIP